VDTERFLIHAPGVVRRVALFLPVVAALSIALHLWRLSVEHDELRRNTLVQAEQRAMQLADAKAREIESLFNGADLLLRQFRDQYAAGNPQAVDASISSGLRAFPNGAIVHFSAVDAQGQIAFSTLKLPGTVYVGDREYFKRHLAGGDSGTERLYITKPVNAPTMHGWVVLFTRPIVKSGRFVGVAVMSLSPAYIAEALARMQVAPDDVVTLVYDDGTYLARSRELDKVMGKALPSDRPFLQPGAPERGVVRVLAVADQRPRTYGWKRTEHFPLLSIVGLDEPSLLGPVDEEIRRSNLRNAVALPLVALMVLAISWLLLRGARQQVHLTASQALLQATFESTADGILVVGQNGHVLKLNPRFQALWGIPDTVAREGSDSALLGHVLEQLADPQAFVRDVESLYGSDEQHLDTVRFKDGRVFERYTQCTRIDNQRVRLWSFRDITERQRMEDALRQSDARFRTLFESSPDAVLLVTDRHFSACNRAAEALFQQGREALLQLGPGDISPTHQPDGEESARKAERMMEMAAAQGLNRFEWVHTRRDGSEFLAEVTLSSIRLQDKPVFYAVVRDITDRQRAEQDLQRSEARARSIFEGARDGILLADARTRRFVDANPTMCNLLGYPRDELLTLGVADIHPEADLARVAGVFDQQARGEVVVGEDLPVLRRDGSVFSADISVSLVHLDGQPFVAGFFRDITERKRVDAELALHQTRLEDLVAERTRQLDVARQAAESANVAKSAFLANMSHEIRTPLNAITGLTYLLQRSSLTPKQRERLDKIGAAGQHLLEIISAVLDLSKIEAGKFALEEAAVDVTAVVARTVALVQERAAENRLRVVSDVGFMPSGLVGDPTRLQQALLNYAANAIKFTRAGSVILRAFPIETDEAGVLVRFEVQDTGIGIAVDQLARLFSAFEQADNSTTRQFGGTGLGLAITRKLAELMGGEAGASSEPGVGSTFWFTARLKRHAPDAAIADAALPDLAEEALRRRHSGRRVLLAEDEPVNREITTSLLDFAGLTVDVATDGAEAVARAAERDFDLVLMDMQMPRMNGLEATRRIRSGDRNRDTPVLALTANAFSEDRARCLDAGMNDFVAKPTDAGALYAALLRWLDAAPQTGRPETT
jgi:PAS domain S-box-containing protein